MPMKRIICHWTAGQYMPNHVDKEHYHFLIDGHGETHRGDNVVADNESTTDGKYAAHTRGCNRQSIGVSICCMAGAVERPFKAGSAPMKANQWTAMVKLVAKLCRQYGIPVTPRTVLSHAEVQGTLGIPQRQKWDYTRLAFDPAVVGAKACGDKLRAEVAAAMT
jgi:N-acetyl-anhydromuramyl-L-alanine amidase AmpD